VTPYVGEDPERILRGWQWRAAKIQRFKQHQQRVREWFNFGDIAEWCAREEQSIVPNEEKRTAAYTALAKDLLAGEFDGKNGRTTVLYLHEQTAKARMTRQWLQDAITHNYDGAGGRQQYLPYCWIRREFFERWRVKHRLPASPHFQPYEKAAEAALKRTKRGRPPVYNWPGVKERLATYVAQHGPIKNKEDLLQTCADLARELHPKHKTPDDSTIRDAIEKYELNVVAAEK
jgi:hypothetical protein